MGEEIELDMELFQAIQEYHEKQYPDRMPPGITPSDPFIYVGINTPNIEGILSEEIKKNIIEINFRKYYQIDLRKYPEQAPQKYYHDKTPIDWNNLEKSNKKYLDSLKIKSIADLYNTQ
jgi:hypothetical protein